MTQATVLAQMGNQNQTFRNRVINGGMSIDQRNNGASQTITAGTTPYTIDRWIGYFGGANGTSQRVGTVGAYSLQFTGAASVTGFQCIQRIESNNIADLAGQTVTLSFTVSSSTQSSVGLFYNTPTAQDNFGSLNTTGTISGGVPVTSTPTRLSYTFSLPSSANNGFQFFFQLGAFTSGTFTITGVQLEKGTVATPFEQRLYGTELALCQRYYQVFSGFYVEGYAPGIQVRQNFPMSFPVQMRSTPTRSVITAGTYTNIRSSSSTYAGLGIVGLTNTFASCSMESAAAGFMSISNQTESMSAEL